ncbi:MAG: GNAT family N-acetyltransferase [Candidatus Eisenbacteria sp.]|nr:GNAT family N-acetyltransferase [Candidatus Eisenbacteria bacterium]
MADIRPFNWSDEDYQSLIDIHNTIFPDELDLPELLKHRDDARDQNYMLDRVVAEVDGRPVGTASFGESMWTPMPGKFWLYIQVHPDHQKQGVGTAIYDHIVGALAEKEPTILDSWTREDKADAVSFLTKRGYKQIMRGQNSRLTLAEFDASKFADVVERVKASGVRIVPLAELRETDPEWREKLYELDWLLSLDVPEVDEPKKREFEVYCKQTFDKPTFFPEGFFVALDGDEYVGVSMLELNLAEPTKLQTDLTGVVRSHRRKGIATALKVHALSKAQTTEAEYLDTDNEEKNPMYTLNVKLGFKPMPGWLHMRNDMRGEAAGEETS